MKRHITMISLIILWSVYALADNIQVPADQPTIQAGISAAMNGDTVLVDDGTYYENINFMGKAITVASYFIMDLDSNHVDNTIINGSQPSHPDSGSVVLFVSGEDTTSVLCGFTITGGTGTYSPPQPPWPGFRNGGGIYFEFSGARICHNKIQLNTITFASGAVGGGGINAGPPGNTSWVILENNIISWNTTTGQIGGGGGVTLASNTKVYYNTIEYNTGTCSEPSMIGGGIMLGSGDPSITIPYERYIIGNVIRFNKALTNGTGSGLGGGLAVFTSPKAIIKYNTITHNEVQSNAGLGVRCYGGGVLLQNQNEETVFANNYVAYNKALPNSICWGAGITLWSYAIPCSPYLNNNIIVNNTDAIHGGGIFTGGLHINQPHLVNNTISQNSASLGGAVYSDGSNTQIENSILWNNGSEIYQDGGIVTVEYSDVQGGWAGIGNIDADPMLYDSTVSPGDTTYCCLPSNSPCVDAGNLHPNYNDLEDTNNPGYALWPAMGGLRNDMGAHGGPHKMVTGIISNNETTMPLRFHLSQNYPNPFNPITNIEFRIPCLPARQANSEFITLKVYNLLGQEVATLLSASLLSGSYTYEWDASNLASGVYLYKLEAGKHVETRKMILMR